MSDLKNDEGFESLPRLVALIWPLEDAEGDLARRINERLREKLNSDWGRGRSSYGAGPFLADAHISAGWQEPRSPRDLIALLLSALDAGPRRFRELGDEAAVDVLSSVTMPGGGRFDGDGSTAFQLLRQLIYELLFVDGWDQEALGWEWLDRGPDGVRVPA